MEHGEHAAIAYTERQEMPINFLAEKLNACIRSSEGPVERGNPRSKRYSERRGCQIVMKSGG